MQLAVFLPTLLLAAAFAAAVLLYSLQKVFRAWYTVFPKQDAC